MVAGRAERGGDQLVGREVVQADRPVSPVAEDDGQVGGEVGVGAVVELVALEDLLDQRLAGLGVGDRQEPRLEVVQERPDVLGLDAPLGLPALLVHEDLAEVALRVGPGLRPVDVPLREEGRLRQPLEAAGLLAPEPADPLLGQAELDHQVVEPLRASRPGRRTTSSA